MTDSPKPSRDRAFVNREFSSDDSGSRLPPVPQTGPLAWVRDNLFGSVTDALLTLVSGVLLVSIISGLAQWVIGSANWFVVTLNLRQFMVGRYEDGATWRVSLLVLFVAFVVGVALAAWTRLRWRAFVGLLLLAGLLMIIPPVINATISLPESALVAGNVGIVSGTRTELPLPQLAFIARADEEVIIRLADDAVANEQALADINGFMDRSANNLRNAANNRLKDIARIAELQSLLASDLLTANQREQSQAELDRLVSSDEAAQARITEIQTALARRDLSPAERSALNSELQDLQVGPPVVNTYALDSVAVQVRLIRGNTGDVVAEGILQPGGDEALTFTLPEDGWYIMDKSIAEGQEGVALLFVRGVYPLYSRSFVRSEVVNEAGEVTTQGGRINQFTRITDSFMTEEARPLAEDGSEIPSNNIIDNQYQGTRPLATYLRVYLNPFINAINVTFLMVMLLTLAGYAFGQVANRFSPPEKPRLMAHRSATWLMIVTPIVLFVLVLGVELGSITILPLTDTRLWGGLLLTVMLTVVGIIGAFPIGVLLALGRRSELPVVKYACTIYIEFVRGVPLITVLFMAQLLVPLVNPALAEVDNVFRAMVGITLFSAAYLAENVRGGLQAIPPGQVEAARALGLPAWQITILITLPQALRIVIPALVGQFIGLFKDTSLVAIVGLIDLVGISQSVVAQTEFLGQRREVFLFISIIYFVVSYVMSYVSRRIEESGSGVIRRR